MEAMLSLTSDRERHALRQVDNEPCDRREALENLIDHRHLVSLRVQEKHCVVRE